MRSEWPQQRAVNRRKIGADYESRAAAYLQAQGYEIVARNFRCRTGEIDIIAREEEYLCFVEVKYRAGAGSGSPLEAVNAHKRRKILGVAKYYLMLHDLPIDTACRMDVVAIEGAEITLLRNAFGE
jgi:putative endonuclease